MPQIIPIRDLKKTNEISQMCKETNEPIFVTKNGYGEMVIMSMEVYEEQTTKPNLYANVEAAEEDVQNGKVMDAEGKLKKTGRI